MYRKYEELTLTATNYNTKVSVELPSDSDANEVFAAMQTLFTGIGFAEQSFKDVVMEYAEVYSAEEQRVIDAENKTFERINKLQEQLDKYKQEEYLRVSNNLEQEA